jgi:uncharacterized membrane protein required for colicin V production
VNNTIAIQAAGIIVSIIVVFAFVLIMRTAKFSDKDYLIRLIGSIFSALVGVWIVDKIISVKLDLLSENESTLLFNFIKDSTLMMFSYYFGKNQKE